MKPATSPTLAALLEQIRKQIKKAYPTAQSASVVVNLGRDLPRVVLPVIIKAATVSSLAG